MGLVTGKKHWQQQDDEKKDAKAHDNMHGMGHTAHAGHGRSAMLGVLSPSGRMKPWPIISVLGQLMPVLWLAP